MKIYSEDGVEGILDLHAAKRELSGVNLINNEGARRQALAELTAGALLDIAASLRAVAADARLSLDPYAGAGEAVDDQPEEREDFLVVGDQVEMPDGAIGTVLSFGMTEGSAYAEVDFDNGPTAKTWLENLSRVADYTPGPDSDDEPEDDGHEPVEIVSAERVAEMLGGVEDDFDGDAHPAAASALDLLKATEAERKAKKKAAKR